MSFAGLVPEPTRQVAKAGQHPARTRPTRPGSSPSDVQRRADPLRRAATPPRARPSAAGRQGGQGAAETARPRSGVGGHHGRREAFLSAVSRLDTTRRRRDDPRLSRSVAPGRNDVVDLPPSRHFRRPIGYSGTRNRIRIFAFVASLRRSTIRRFR